MPLFSIIVPVYNRAALVGEALDSVFAQSCGDFEVIVIDDGSTDGTAEVLADYRDRARLLYQSNSGPGAARNLGLSRARGEYAVFLDSDDFWPPWTLAVYAQVIDAHQRPSIIVNVPVRQTLGQPCAPLVRNGLNVEGREDFLIIGRDMSRFKSSVLPVAPVRLLRDSGGFAAKPIQPFPESGKQTNSSC